jgi:hypothetical protein
MENENVPQNENEVKYPSVGASFAFGLGFLVMYVVIVFTVLGVFFRIPF